MSRGKRLPAAILSCLLALALLTACAGPEVSPPAEGIVISFNSDGGSPVESMTLSPDQPLDLPEQPVREGYAFAGWVLEGDGSRVGAGHTFPAGSGAVILRALWEEETTSQGNTSPDGNETAGNTEADPAGTESKDADIADDNTYVVVFDSRGGEAMSNQINQVGQPLYLGENPTRAGYTFVTWEDQWGMPIGHGLENIEVEWEAEAGQVITLYAVWE